jgi:hypothetical protein
VDSGALHPNQLAKPSLSQPTKPLPPSSSYRQPWPALIPSSNYSAAPVLDLTDFKRDLSELTDRLGNAQDCL